MAAAGLPRRISHIARSQAICRSGSAGQLHPQLSDLKSDASANWATQLFEKGIRWSLPSRLGDILNLKATRRSGPAGQFAPRGSTLLFYACGLEHRDRIIGPI